MSLRKLLLRNLSLIAVALCASLVAACEQREGARPGGPYGGGQERSTQGGDAFVDENEGNNEPEGHPNIPGTDAAPGASLLPPAGAVTPRVVPLQQVVPPEGPGAAPTPGPLPPGPANPMPPLEPVPPIDEVVLPPRYWDDAGPEPEENPGLYPPGVSGRAR